MSVADLSSLVLNSTKLFKCIICYQNKNVSFSFPAFNANLPGDCLFHYLVIIIIISLLNFLYPNHLIVYLSVYLFFPFVFSFLPWCWFFFIVIKTNTATFIRNVVPNVFIFFYCQDSRLLFEGH